MSDEIPKSENEDKEVLDSTLEEAQNATGIKEEKVNEDAVHLAEISDDPEEVQQPSFFVEEDDRIIIELDVLFEKEKGRLVSIARKGLTKEELFKVLGHSEETFEFSVPNYDQMSNYRERCSSYRRDAGRLLTDPLKLRNYFLVWHLKDWSLRDRHGEKIDLSFNDKGALDKESIKKAYKINPTMMDVVMTLLERDLML